MIENLIVKSLESKMSSKTKDKENIPPKNFEDDIKGA